MKKVKFIFSTTLTHQQVEEVVEVEDNTTEEEINEMYEEFVWEHVTGEWKYTD